MRKLSAYNFLTLNGFFKGPTEDSSGRTHGEEEAKYSEEALKIVFSRSPFEPVWEKTQV